MMWERGYLDTKQMAGAFQMLRSRDLVWSKMVHDYLLGKRVAMNDLMAWNADATRMPVRMHAEYLQHMFLDNDLAEGRHHIGDASIAIEDIHAPIFAVGTETDHVAPWKSVHKITLLSDSEVTFVLTTGGHNAGIVSEPGHKRRSYRIATKGPDAPYVDPEHWGDTATKHEGSWWLAWFDWLAKHSGEKVAPPPMGAPKKGYAPVCDAPGTYVLMP
jgi:polyhydroxyalkanoate synthase